MHTTGDPIVPYWHETLYNAKTLFGGSAFKHLNIPIDRYGHCAFTAQESLAAFAVLRYMVTGTCPTKRQRIWPLPRRTTIRSWSKSSAVNWTLRKIAAV